MAKIRRKQLVKQKNLIIIILILIVFIIFIVWQFYYGTGYEPKEEELISEYFEKIEVNFDILDDPQLKGLRKIEEIPPYEGKIGRDIPFAP